MNPTDKQIEEALEYFELTPGKSVGVCRIGCPAFDHAYTIIRAYKAQAEKNIKDDVVFISTLERAQKAEAKVVVLESHLSGRTVSCSNCNELSRKLEEAKEKLESIAEIEGE